MKFNVLPLYTDVGSKADETSQYIQFEEEICLVRPTVTGLTHAVTSIHKTLQAKWRSSKPCEFRVPKREKGEPRVIGIYKGSCLRALYSKSYVGGHAASP